MSMPSRNLNRPTSRFAHPLRRALAELAPAERAILVLREYEELSHDELAAIIGCRIGTVKSRLSRARLALKNALLRLAPDLREEYS